MMSDDTSHGRDLEREAKLVYAMFNMIAPDTSHRLLDKPVPLISANEPALVIAPHARIGVLIVSGSAVDAGFPRERAWVEKSQFDLLLLSENTRDDADRIEVDVLRAGSDGAIDEGRYLLWSGEDDVRFEMSGLWLVTPDETSAELSRALLVTGNGVLASERPPYRNEANRMAGLHVAAQAFRHLMIAAGRAHDKT